MTSTELARALSVSHSSVMRFTKDLGFSGYTEFQHVIREQYNAYISSHSQVSTIPTVKLTQSLEKLPKSSIIETVQDITFHNIRSVVMRNSTELFEKASDTIIHSHTKYIVGSRACSVAANFLSINLKDTLPMVFPEPSDSLTFFNSQIPALFMAELLCTYISQKVGNKNEENLRLIDRYASSMELY